MMKKAKKRKRKNEKLRHKLILENRNWVAWYLKMLRVDFFHRYRDDAFAAGILGLVIAADEYDFDNYPASDFKKYAGFHVKAEIYKELYGTNRRADGKIKTETSRVDTASRNYESMDRHPKRWSKWIGLILKASKMNRAEFAKLIGVHNETVGEWVCSRSVPNRDNQKRIVGVLKGGL